VRIGKESKHFFFKKKKQKTFVLFCAGLLQRPGTEGNKSFLLLFFKKEVLAYLRLPRAPGANHPHMTMCDAEL